MPMRQDPSLWWNIPGIVAAYQPVRAPDSLLARYNMRQGGTNAYRAEAGVLPTWSAATGWTFDGTQFLNTNLSPTHPASMIVRFSRVDTALSARVLAGSSTATQWEWFALVPYYSGQRLVAYYTIFTDALSGLTSGVYALTSEYSFLNGKIEKTVGGTALGAQRAIYIGGINETQTGSVRRFGGSIQSVAIYNRTLSPAEVWMASRQMAYCDVNPDWNVWSPRRKWFPYVLAAGGFQAAWAERANRLIGGG